MKKIYMLAVMVIAIAITSCTKEAAIPSIPATDEATTQSGVSADADAPTTRAAIPALTESAITYWSTASACIDDKGTLWGMNGKAYWSNYNPNAYRINTIYLFNIFKVLRLSRSAAVDIYEASYFITPDNQLIKVTANYDCPFVNGVEYFVDPYVVVSDSPYLLAPNVVDLSSSFPNGTVFLSLTAADNGNVFITTGNGSDGEYGDTFPKHTVYRIASNGNVTEIATVNAPVSATMVADWGGDETQWGTTIDQIEYPSILSKAKGTVLYGFDANGEIYKVSTTQGTVEYFTPRVPIKCLTAALNGNNPYVLSGNTIIEVRPTLAKDIVVGTIPAEIAAGAYTLRVSPDATEFYVGVKSDIHYPFVSKFTVE